MCQFKQQRFQYQELLIFDTASVIFQIAPEAVDFLL